jgi:hypothetical protein
MAEKMEHHSFYFVDGPTTFSSQQVKNAIPADRFTSSMTPSSPDEYLRTTTPQRILGFFRGVRVSKALLVSQALCGHSSTQLSRYGRMEHMLSTRTYLRQAEQSRGATEDNGGGSTRVVTQRFLVSQALCGHSSTHLSRDGRMEHMIY